MSPPAESSVLDPPVEAPLVERPAKDRAELARFVPALIVLAIGIVLLTRDGGFIPLDWYPAALACIGVAVVTLYVGVRPPTGIRLWAMLALAGYVVFAYLSILWADVRDIAWQGANLTLLYAVVFGCMAVSRLSARATALLVAAYCTGVAAVGCGVIALAAHRQADPDISTLFAGRLSAPTGYPNATAAIFALALWAMLGIALQEDLQRLLRAWALGSAGVLAGLNVLCQSRGSVFTLPLVVVVFLVFARRRMIAAGVVAVVGVTTALMTPMLLRVFRAETPAERHDELRSALVALAISGAVLGILGLGLPLLDRIPRPSRRGTRILRVGVAAAAVVVVAAAIAAGSPRERLSAGWDSFRNGSTPSGSSRFVGLGSNRYDFWRVGVSEFRDHPIIGIGVDNFAVPYFAARRSDEQPLYPHSLWVRVISQTGVIGALLLTAFFALATMAALARRPRLPRSLVGGMLTGVAAWLLHAQVDWLWEMPALGFGAFALLGLAFGVEDDSAGSSAPASVRRRLALRIAWVGVAVVAVAAIVVPWMSLRLQERAAAAWGDDPTEALAAAHRAGRIDRLSDAPLLISGVMLGRLGDFEASRRDLDEAVRRNPFNWYTRVELAVANSQLGDRMQALEHARRAHELNPRDATVASVLGRLERGERVDPTQVDESIAGNDPTT